jgi:hypothetical protein
MGFGGFVMPIKDDPLKINLYRLEKEAAGQAQLMRDWGQKWADAEKALKMLKNALKVARAEIAKAVRTNPANYGVNKLTEGSIEEVLTLNSILRKQENELVEAEYERDIIKAMVVAIHERGEMISNEVKLHGQQYWSKPTADPEFNKKVREDEAVETMKKAARATED